MPPRLELPPQFAELLASLRRKIRAYVFVEGTARVVILLGLLFWFTLGLDWLWFRISRLELPQWVRMSLLVGAFGLVAFGLVSWLLLRFLPGMRAKALALVLERRFPELDDRLITAVEMAEANTGRETPLTMAMLQRTVNDAARVMPTLSLGSVFERRGLQRALIGAVVLVASVVGLGVVNASAMDHWYKAWIQVAESYWRRETDLRVRVLVPPRDEPRSFRDFTYKHPIGGDLTIQVEIPEGKRPDGKDWVVPEKVVLQYVMDNGRGRGSVTMSKLGDRLFRHTLSNQIESLDLWVVGGDYTNRRPYRVDAVAPPHIDRLDLDCDYPEHTGLNGTDLVRQNVKGTQITVPIETKFLLRGTINKPLHNVRIEYGTKRISFGWFPKKTPPAETGAIPSEEELPPRVFEAFVAEEGDETNAVAIDEATAKRFLSDDRSTFSVPMALTGLETPAATERAGKPLAGGLSEYGLPFVLSPDTPIRVYLEDADDIVSAEPSRLTINAKLDEPPKVETELQGVGTSITRTALIPVKGLLADDYGLTAGRFEFKLGDDEDWLPREFRAGLKGTPREHLMSDVAVGADGRPVERPVEKFDVIPLNLAIGKKLTLTVFASDGDTLNGPHHSRGEQFTFTIVSNEEFLSILYSREVGYRQRFKQIMEEVEGSRRDLILQRAKYQEYVELKGSDKREDRTKAESLETAIFVAAERALHQVRKNANETAGVEESFRSLLEELVNNRVHTEQMVLRIKGLIVDPLHAIVEIDFPDADGSIGLFKLANEKRQNPTGPIDNSIESLTRMLEHMEKVLKEMQDLAEFHEAIKELKLIIDDSEKVRQETDREKKRELIEKLKDTKSKLEGLK